MHEFGLIGFPLDHSFSKKYFAEKFEREHLTGYSYQLFPIENISLLPDLINGHPDLCGLNVTIPFKISIIPFLDSLDPIAKVTGAVNTVKIHKENGKKLLTGYNTDVIGFEKSLKQFISNEKPKALILGTGGASKAIAYVLKKLNLSFLFVSRHPNNDETIDYQQLDKKIIQTHQLIINATPLGSFPKTANYPDIPYSYLTAGHFLFDLVYNPAISIFLTRGKDQNCRTINGLQMLEIQANESFKIWLKD